MSIEITEVTRQTWITFVDEIEPLRRDLFRYSLKLTGNPFDAEDLVHDGMLKAFSSMASHQKPLLSPKPYLLRIISNLWIDSIRRSRFSLLADGRAVDEIVNDDLREAVAKLVVSVNPREQVIIVLSEVFEMTHKEIIVCIKGSTYCLILILTLSFITLSATPNLYLYPATA